MKYLFFDRGGRSGVGGDMVSGTSWDLNYIFYASTMN